MITIVTNQPRKRAQLHFHNHLIPVASTLFPRDPQKIMGKILAGFNRTLKLNPKSNRATGVLSAKRHRLSVYRVRYTTPPARLDELRHLPENDLCLFICDELYGILHTELNREFGNKGYVEPALILWKKCGLNKRIRLSELGVDSFEKFRKKLLTELRSLVAHESESRRTALEHERQTNLSCA